MLPILGISFTTSPTGRLCYALTTQPDVVNKLKPFRRSDGSWSCASQRNECVPWRCCRILQQNDDQLDRDWREVLMASSSLKDYHLYEEVGRSQHSVVYRGRKKHAIEFVAVKRVEHKHSSRLSNQVRDDVSRLIAFSSSLISCGACLGFSFVQVESPEHPAIPHVVPDLQARLDHHRVLRRGQSAHTSKGG